MIFYIRLFAQCEVLLRNLSFIKYSIKLLVLFSFQSEELLEQLKKAMKALEDVIIPPPYSMEDFARVLGEFAGQ